VHPALLDDDTNDCTIGAWLVGFDQLRFVAFYCFCLFIAMGYESKVASFSL
jgi:hypothetical protein